MTNHYKYFPHKKENYGRIMARLKEEMEKK